MKKILKSIMCAVLFCTIIFSFCACSDDSVTYINSSKSSSVKSSLFDSLNSKSNDNSSLFDKTNDKTSDKTNDNSISNNGGSFFDKFNDKSNGNNSLLDQFGDNDSSSTSSEPTYVYSNYEIKFSNGTPSEFKTELKNEFDRYNLNTLFKNSKIIINSDSKLTIKNGYNKSVYKVTKVDKKYILDGGSLDNLKSSLLGQVDDNLNFDLDLYFYELNKNTVQFIEVMNYDLSDYGYSNFSMTVEFNFNKTDNSIDDNTTDDDESETGKTYIYNDFKSEFSSNLPDYLKSSFNEMFGTMFLDSKLIVNSDSKIIMKMNDDKFIYSVTKNGKKYNLINDDYTNYFKSLFEGLDINMDVDAYFYELNSSTLQLIETINISDGYENCTITIKYNYKTV